VGVASVSAALMPPNSIRRIGVLCVVSKNVNGRIMLTCTNCHSPIWASASTEVWGFVDIECSNVSCGAQWNGRGEVLFAGFESEKK